VFVVFAQNIAFSLKLIKYAYCMTADHLHPPVRSCYNNKQCWSCEYQQSATNV